LVFGKAGHNRRLGGVQALAFGALRDAGVRCKTLDAFSRADLNVDGRMRNRCQRIRKSPMV